MLGGDVLVFEIGGLFKRLLQQLVDFVGERGLDGFSGDLGEFLDLFVDFGQDGLRADADLFEHRRNDAFIVFEQRGEQVKRAQFGITVLRGELVRTLDGFLRFNGEFVPTDWHGEPRIE